MDMRVYDEERGMDVREGEVKNFGMMEVEWRT